MAKDDALGVALFSVLAAIAVSLLPLSTAHARSPDPPNVKTIQAATFEVLAPVAGAGSNGVVGTAFAIGPNQFVTAAHTLDQIIGSRFARPVLMDSKRVGYEIAAILHYSQPQDYVVFSLVNPPPVTPLELRRDDGAQRAVYFAGRRSGGGIVITRGTLIGRTREAESGQFDWLRFKSRIWAGVSGGPLLDETGEVIGIVRARAVDGDANYAVPIALLPSGPSDRAQLHSLDLLKPLGPSVPSDEPFEGEIPLPMPYDAFARELVRLRAQYFDRTVGVSLEASRGGFVIAGRGADSVCDLINGERCECKAARDVKGVLLMDEPNADARARRASTGASVTQVVAGVVVVREGGGRYASTKVGLSADALAHLKLALKGEPDLDAELSASARRADIEVADLDEVYEDFHGRAWRVREWPLADEDLKIVSLGRDLPDGRVALMRIVPTAAAYGALLQLKFVGNLIYYGCADSPPLNVVDISQRPERR
jgi:serine protease Do